MNPTPSPATDAPPELPADVAHLFRHDLRARRVHPLMHWLLRHRQAQAAQAEADTQAPSDPAAPPSPP